MINKKQISSALALSCVEYYFLPWISQFYPVEKLYVQSFVPLKQLFDDFSRGNRYETYTQIPRIQDTAEQFGIIKHTFTPATIHHAADMISGQGENELCLIRVNNEFMSDYKRKPWREDHYICVDRDLNWVNEYPLSDGTLNTKKFMQSYDGAVLLFGLQNMRNVSDNEVSQQLRCQNFENIEPNIGLDKFEEALGVLRVSRKRLGKLYADQTEVQNLFYKENSLLDKLYFSIRLQRIKRRGNESELYGGVNQIIAIEKAIAEVLK